MLITGRDQCPASAVSRMEQTSMLIGHQDKDLQFVPSRAIIKEVGHVVWPYACFLSYVGCLKMGVSTFGSFFEIVKKDRSRLCRKMFLDPDVPLSRTHTLLARDVGKPHGCGMLVSFRLMCFQTVTLSSNISAQNARKLLPAARKTCHSRDSSVSE
jgi:hypothetical protein